MKTLHRWLLLVAIVGCSVGCDQATKRLATAALRLSAPRSYLADIFRLEYAENPGAFLSLGATLGEAARNWVLTGAVGVFLLGLLVYCATNRKLTAVQVAACALLLGGGWSNWIDRCVRHGLVVDFMNLGIGRLRTGIFNVADLAIVAGVVLLVLAPQRKATPTPLTPSGVEGGAS